MRMDIGTFLLMLAVSYALGVLWYDLLPGRLPMAVWRVAGYPFLGIFVANMFLPHFSADPKFGGLGLISTFVGSLIAVIVDWIITSARQPAIVRTIESHVDAGGVRRTA
jgi:hypothetical protein